MTPFASTVFSASFPNQPGFFFRYFRILGLVRLRQVRVKKDSCRIPDSLAEYITECYGPFSESVMDSAPFGPVDPNTNTGTWKWYSEAELKEGSYTGRSNIDYPGSGFNVTLPMDYSGVLEKLYYLKDNNWIDRQTRAIFIDFIVYNANTRLITLVKVAIEFPASSGCRPFLLLRTSRIDRLVGSEMSRTAMLAETILLVLVSLYIVHEVLNFRRLRWKYFRDSWVYVEIVNYFLFIGAFILRFQPFDQVSRKGFPPRPDEFINYETAMWAIIQWKNIMSINSVITWMRLFKYVRAVPFMQLLIGTISLAMGQVLSFLSIFIIILSGFTLANLLAFGGELAQFRSYEFTLYTLYRSLLGADYFEDMYEVNRFLGPALFIGWTMIGFFLLLNMFVAILNDAIDEVKSSIPKTTLLEMLTRWFVQLREWAQAKYRDFLEDKEDEDAKQRAKLTKLQAFQVAKQKEEETDPLQELKDRQRQKLKDTQVAEMIAASTKEDVAQDAPAETQQKGLTDCDNDEERLQLLENRLGALLKGMNKLRGPELVTGNVDVKNSLLQKQPSNFANPYGVSSLKSTL